MREMIVSGEVLRHTTDDGIRIKKKERLAKSRLYAWAVVRPIIC